MILSWRHMMYMSPNLCQPTPNMAGKHWTSQTWMTLNITWGRWLFTFMNNLHDICNQQTKHHDDVNKWKHFPRYWPFVRGIPHKGQWRGALMFCLICVWINIWVNNRETGDLRRYRAHYDAIVMIKWERQNWQNWTPELATPLAMMRRSADKWKTIKCRMWQFFSWVLFHSVQLLHIRHWFRYLSVQRRLSNMI